MGFKRPFDSEEFQELPLKQARPVDCRNKLTQFADNIPYHNMLKKSDIDDHENGFVDSQLQESFVDDSVMGGPNLSKDVETSAPLSLVTSSSSDEDVGSGSAAYSTRLPAYPEFEFPLRTFLPFEDFYSPYSDHSPRRQVPVGPNHQASIPSWAGHIEEEKLEQVESCNHDGSSFSTGSDDSFCRDEERLMGTCIIPMQDVESSEVGIGRGDCDCPDEGSVRCVQHHITEAREKLRKSLGPENFVKLGFDDMGEDVSGKWTEEEERIFCAVVYSNPASLGQNFWKHLPQVFPSRTMKEIVSYYFNVFMLRRRAAQNRSISLDIDSDDDEFHGIIRESNEDRISEDEDSAIESLPEQCEPADKGGETLAEDDEDDIDDDNDDDSDGDGDVGDGSRDATGEDSGLDYVSEPHDVESLDLSRFDHASKHMDVKAANVDFTVQDDSCMSFELQADKTEYSGAVETEAALQANGAHNEHNKCLTGKGDGFSDMVGQVYLLDACDAKVWDSRFTSPIKGVDLLPTCNIIEEIFGQGTCDDKTKK